MALRVCFAVISWRDADSPQFLKDDFDGAVPPDSVGFSEVNDILREIDEIFDPERPDDHSDSRDVSAWDKRTSPVVSLIDESREDTVVRPQSPSLPLPLPPKNFLVLSRTRNSVGRAWSGLKKSLVKKFWGGGQLQPRLSAGLVPECRDEVKLDSARFPGGGFKDVAKKSSSVGPIKSRMSRGQPSLESCHQNMD